MLSDEDKLLVNQILMDEIGCDGEEIEPQTKLIDELGIDSLDWAEIFVRLEEQFGIPEPDDCEFDRIITVQDLYDYIAERRSRNVSAAN